MSLAKTVRKNPESCITVNCTISLFHFCGDEDLAPLPSTLATADALEITEDQCVNGGSSCYEWVAGPIDHDIGECLEDSLIIQCANECK
jgi:hypothetical protein